MNFKASWRWVDTRTKSGRIFHHINMEQHLKALAKSKPKVKLHEPDETWVRLKKARASSAAKALPPAQAFQKELATSPEYE